MKTLYKPHQNILREKVDSVMKAPPTYNIEFPTNVFTIENEDEIDRISNMEKRYDFWTDGSCQPNPGPGGAGYFSTNFMIKEKIHVIDHDTTINYAELIGVQMVLLSIWRYVKFVLELNESNKDQIILDDLNINIHTDSMLVFRLLNKDGYPKLDYIYKLLQSMFEICNKLKCYNININIIKVRSHKGNYGNQMADQLAKSAANLANMCKYGKSKFIKYNISKNAVNVDIAKDSIKLRKHLKNQRKSKWIDIKNDRINNKNMNMYHGCHNFENSIIDPQNFIAGRNKDMKNELKYLTQKECEIIMKLRTEHINLNHYLYTMDIVNSYNCKWCTKLPMEVPETVDHFLLNCKGCVKDVIKSLHKNNVEYDGFRNILKKELRKISSFFKQPNHFTVQNILFPHVWQQRLNGTRKSDNWKRDGTYYRVEILKAVVKFVLNTKRFRNDYGY